MCVSVLLDAVVHPEDYDMPKHKVIGSPSEIGRASAKHVNRIIRKYYPGANYTPRQSVILPTAAAWTIGPKAYFPISPLRKPDPSTVRHELVHVGQNVKAGRPYRHTGGISNPRELMAYARQDADFLRLDNHCLDAALRRIKHDQSWTTFKDTSMYKDKPYHDRYIRYVVAYLQHDAETGKPFGR
jgi:hypothetical protein